MGKGHRNKVLNIKISKTWKMLTVNFTFEGYADIYAKFTLCMMQN